MKKLIYLPALLVAVFVFPSSAYAHCPLCTAGAGAAAGVAVWLGVSVATVGVFLGAASILMGWWIANRVKKQYVPYQNALISVIFWATIILPLYPMFGAAVPLSVAVAGDYGGLLHRVYPIDLFLLGSVVGALAAYIAPRVSAFAGKLRNGKKVPYQGVAVTLLLLTIVSIGFEIWL